MMMFNYLKIEKHLKQLIEEKVKSLDWPCMLIVSLSVAGVSAINIVYLDTSKHLEYEKDRGWYYKKESIFIKTLLTTTGELVFNSACEEESFTKGGMEYRYFVKESSDYLLKQRFFELLKDSLDKYNKYLNSQMKFYRNVSKNYKELNAVFNQK